LVPAGFFDFVSADSFVLRAESSADRFLAGFSFASALAPFLGCCLPLLTDFVAMGSLRDEWL